MAKLVSSPVKLGIHRKVGPEAFFAGTCWCLNGVFTNLVTFGSFPEGSNIWQLVASLDPLPFFYLTKG